MRGCRAGGGMERMEGRGGDGEPDELILRRSGFFNKQQTVKLLSNQSLWIMRERETRAHTHAGWEDEKTTRLIILRPIFITVPSVISLTDSNSPQLCVRWQMKTNYGNCFVNLKADSLPSSRTYTDNPVGPRNYPLLTAHQHTCVPVCACVCECNTFRGEPFCS